METRSGALAPVGAACLEKVIRCLDKVRSSGRNRWMARCPAHEDRSPSLAITETSDGVVLLKCFAGCTAHQIVNAIGLEMRDLFPGSTPARSGPSRKAVEHEQMIYRIGKALSDQGRLAGDDLQRFELAKQRLGVA